jgi:hypothetical protein
MRVLMLVECVWTGGCSTGGRHLVAATVADGDMATAFKPWKPSTALYLLFSGCSGFGWVLMAHE